MYWRISILQDIYLEYMENVIKVCIQSKSKAEFTQKNKEKAHVPCKSGQTTDKTRA